MLTSPDSVPTVSVMMPAHNARRFIDDAVRSILDQTFRDLELVVVDDASTDGTTEALREWARRDDRIRLFAVSENLGLPLVLNYLLERVRGRFIARMDADDMSHPDRIRREVEVLERHPEAASVATLWIGIDEHGSVVRPRDRWRLLRGRPYAPFPHGSIMVRHEALQRVGNYRNVPHWEDFELYLRLQTISPILVIPDALFVFRFHSANSRILAKPHDYAYALDLLDRCIREFRNGRDYAPLLDEPIPPTPENYMTPARLLFMTGASQLWSGQRPTIIRELARNRVFPTSPSRLALWLLSTIAYVAPHAFRSTLAAAIQVRDLAAGAFIGGEPVPWKFE